MSSPVTCPTLFKGLTDSQLKGRPTVLSAGKEHSQGKSGDLPTGISTSNSHSDINKA